jgi:hypothetical protein
MKNRGGWAIFRESVLQGAFYLLHLFENFRKFKNVPLSAT